MLHSFCALVNHILHMCKMCVTSKILGTCAKCTSQAKYWANVRRRYTLQYVCSLRTILKICAKYAQFAHNPQDMCTICAVRAHNKNKKRKKKKVQHRLLVTRPSTGQAQCSSTGAFNVVWSQTPTAIQEDLLYVQLHCLK